MTKRSNEAEALIAEYIQQRHECEVREALVTTVKGWKNGTLWTDARRLAPLVDADVSPPAFLESLLAILEDVERGRTTADLVVTFLVEHGPCDNLRPAAEEAYCDDGACTYCALARHMDGGGSGRQEVARS